MPKKVVVVEEELTPPDLKRCQAEYKEPHRPFGVGAPPPRWERCHRKPLYIATEAPRSDGKKQGSMSVCGTCKNELLKQKPDVILERITKSKLSIKPRKKDGKAVVRIGKKIVGHQG